LKLAFAEKEAAIFAQIQRVFPGKTLLESGKIVFNQSEVFA